ncbi:hypothetical protein JOM56_001464 [Amanita muscaria]
MPPLPQLTLPLPNQLPDGYGWENRESSTLQTTTYSTAFDTGIDDRDTFLGKKRCIVCGAQNSLVRRSLHHCHIIPKSEPGTWTDLQRRGWFPSEAKTDPAHEPRNGLLLCRTHHGDFDEYSFFIRFVPHTGRFIFINYSNELRLQEFHGRAVALVNNHRYSPFPALFLVHEMRVRGFHPFAPVNPNIPDDIAWQEWIVSEGVFNEALGLFRQETPPTPSNRNIIRSFSVRSLSAFRF